MTGFYIKERTDVRSEGLATSESENAKKRKRRTNGGQK